ncbi:MAG: hypothetical protein ACOYM3_19370 [Terrimicrobiaceae bacterium]
MNSTATGNGTAAALKCSSSYNGILSGGTISMRRTRQATGNL